MHPPTSLVLAISLLSSIPTVLGSIVSESSSMLVPRSTPTTAPPPPGETYVTGYPLCNITGYTETPGPYIETTQSKNSTLVECLHACRRNVTCGSVAFAAEYAECLFYDAVVEKTQLYEDPTSFFDHFDKGCRVGRG